MIPFPRSQVRPLMTESSTDDTTPAPGFDLSAEEARVLGVLIEKSFLTPDIYPLSLNALVTGSNQLTGREPVMKLSESDAQAALDRLISLRWASKRDQAGARVPKYEHLVRMRHSLPPPEQAVLAMLLLRGAQTAGEIRSRCERMHNFSDIAEVDSLLEHLAEKFPPIAVELPRAPGTKEPRHMHLLCGEPDMDELALAAAGPAGGSGGGKLARLEQEVTELRTELATLRAEYAAFRKQFE
jgi:uncharacterized protein YceH (UPF0502 family)